MMTPPVDNLTMKIDGLERAVKAKQLECEHLRSEKAALEARNAELASTLAGKADIETQVSELQAKLTAAQAIDGVINAAAGKVQALTEAITSSLPAS